MQSVSRTVDVAFNTIVKLLIAAGEACAEFHHRTINDVKAKRVECDEIWSFCYAKQKNALAIANPPSGRIGDVWTWVAMDSDSKLIISYLVGGRDVEYAKAFIDDVKSRLANRVQLTTDGYKPYLEAVERSFGSEGGLCSISQVLRV